MQAIVVCCDALPPAYLGCYGSEWVLTPNIDRLAFRGWVFDHGYTDHPSAGNTLRSADSGRSIFATPDSDAPGLFVRLAEQGIRCALFANQPVPSQVDTHWPASSLVSFDEPAIDPADWAAFDSIRQQPHYHVPADTPGLEGWIDRWRRQLGRERRAGVHPPNSLEAIFAEAQRWLERNAGEPSLVWLQLALFGGEAIPPPADRALYPEVNETILIDPMPGDVDVVLAEEHFPALRLGCGTRVSWFDRLLGAFLDGAPVGDPDRLVILTADQGFPLGEHGTIGPVGEWLYEERNHVPLIVSHSDRLSACRSDALVQARDLHATLADSLGVPRASGSTGISLLEYLRPEPTAGREFVCSMLEGQLAIRTADWKLLVPGPIESKTDPPPRELYAKPADRWDVNDLANSSTELADLLEQHLRRGMDADRTGTEATLPLLADLLAQADAAR